MNQVKSNRHYREARHLTLLASCLLVGKLAAVESVSSDDPYVIVTSDTHISAPAGRYSYITPRVENFFTALSALSKPPSAVFIVGDVIDNAIEVEGKVGAGDRKHFEEEVALFDRFKTARSDWMVRATSLGPGHDFVGEIALPEAERGLGPARGCEKINGFDFIWFTIKRAAFSEDSTGDYSDVLSLGDYEWVSDQLRHAHRAFLLFHVPLRTPEAERLGKWPGGRSLAIDSRDSLYTVIREHKEKLVAIFSGHIHQAFTSSFEGIPVYSAPFMSGDFAVVRLSADAGRPSIRLHRVDDLLEGKLFTAEQESR